MYNYNINEKIWQDSSFFVMYKIESDAWLNTSLPEPSLISKLKNGYNIIGFAIRGFMGTKKSKEFARDVIFKIKHALEHAGAQDVKIYPFFPSQELLLNKNNIINDFVYELNDLNIPVPKKFYSYRADVITFLSKYAETNRETEDALFDAIRFTVYDFVKYNSKEALTLDYVNLIALEKYEQIRNKKGESTARAKAKAIFRWVKEKYNPSNGTGVWNWNYVRKTKTDKELKMLRSENAKKLSKQKYDENHKKIMSLVTGIFKNEYIKKDGTYNVNKIARDLKLTRKTVYKHLEDARLYDKNFRQIKKILNAIN